MNSVEHARCAFKWLLLFLAPLMFCGGCAALAALPLGSALGSPNSQNLQIQSSTQVRIQQKNFIVVRTNVVGQSRGFSLLGFITIVPARVTTAMNRLYDAAHVQEGQSQSLANMMLEENSSYYILFGIPRTTIRADMVEFTAPTPAAPPPLPEHEASGREPPH